MTFPRHSRTRRQIGPADEGAGSVGITSRFLAQEPRKKSNAVFRDKKARRGSFLPRLCGAFGDWVSGSGGSWIATEQS